MSSISNLLQVSASNAATIQVLPLLRVLGAIAAMAALILFFKPLLLGLGRALLLLVRPRLSKEEQAAQRQMRDAQLMQQMINSSSGPSDAAELRALSSRS